MQTETHDMKLVVCVDSTMEPVCLARTMIAVERLRQKLARTSTLRHCMELAVLGFDEIGFTIQPLAPLEQGEPLPPCMPYAGRWIRSTAIRYPTFGCSLMTNAILKTALDTAAGHGTPTHTVLVLLTQRVSPEARLFSGFLTKEQMGGALPARIVCPEHDRTPEGRRGDTGPVLRQRPRTAGAGGEHVCRVSGSVRSRLSAGRLF